MNTHTPLADCITCYRPVDAELAICSTCLTTAQQVITDTADAYALIPDTTREIIGLRAIRYDKPPAGSPDAADLPFGLNVKYDDPEDTRISAIRQPETALDILHSWADAWADQRGLPVQGSVFTYLVTSTRWAAQHPEESRWHDYLDEARRVRNVVRRLAGVNPVTVPTPCPRCGDRVVQTWHATDGLDDQHTCTGCRTTWEGPGPFVREAVKTITDLDIHAPDMLVTAEDARAIYPDLKRNTLNVWLKRDRERPGPDRLPAQGKTTDGFALYRLGDITQLHRGPEKTGDSAATTTEGSAA